MRREKICAVLSILVIFVGIGNVGGYIFDSENIRQIFKQTAASPLPLPFNDILGNQHNFSYSMHFVVYEQSGRQLDYQVSEIFIEGPHRRKITYASAFLFAPTHALFALNTLQYGFCSSKRPLVKDLATHPQSVDVYIKSRIPELEKEWLTTIVCSN